MEQHCDVGGDWFPSAGGLDGVASKRIRELETFLLQGGEVFFGHPMDRTFIRVNHTYNSRSNQALDF